MQVTIDVAFCYVPPQSSNISLQLLQGITALWIALGVMLLILAVETTQKPVKGALGN